MSCVGYANAGRKIYIAIPVSIVKIDTLRTHRLHVGKVRPYRGQ